MSEGVSVVFTLACEIGTAVGFSFDDPGDHLTDEGVWRYDCATADGWGWLMAGPGDDAVATAYPGWGEIDLDPYHLALFKDGALAGLLTPHGGTLGGMFQADVDHVADLEDHLIDLLCTELDYRGGDTAAFRTPPESSNDS